MTVKVRYKGPKSDIFKKRTEYHLHFQCKSDTIILRQYVQGFMTHKREYISLKAFLKHWTII